MNLSLTLSLLILAELVQKQSEYMKELQANYPEKVHMFLVFIKFVSSAHKQIRKKTFKMFL
jgi:hypothetical protein